ncbi:MAG: peptide deformylase [Defluviicoccus sp.]|nr:MAG: peptide deformylase [Defluviicoccus sp.]
MALLKIARMGHPVLRRAALPVADPSAARIVRLLADMAETMADAGGIGLAAPQVHVPLRVVMFMVPAVRAAEPHAPAGSPGGSLPLSVLINPEIEPLGEEMEESWEGCLSVPGLTGLVPRFRRIRYSGVDAEGQAVSRIAEGFHARVVQHECDHLDGILYPARMRDLRHFGFVDELQRSVRMREDEEARSVAAEQPDQEMSQVPAEEAN